MEQLTPEAKAAVMQLMGQTYGQVKKQDEMLVGTSNNLRPKSNELKSMVENLVRTPVAPPINQPPVQPITASQQAITAEQITPEQAMRELQNIAVDASAMPGTLYQYENSSEQLVLNFNKPDKIDQLIDVVKENNLLLKGIKLQLENCNVRPKRKSAKVKVTD